MSIASTTVIRVIDGRLAWYPPGAGDQPSWLDNDVDRQRLVALCRERVAPCFAVPGADVRLLCLELSADEKKHIGKSLPFMLEEDVAIDIEQIHFSSSAVDKTRLAVALCAREKMLDWQARLAQYPGVRQWLPEQLLLPWQPGEWCVVREGDAAIVRTGQCEGFSVETQLLPQMLAAALRGQESPQAIIFYGQQQQADTELLPAELHDKLQWRRGSFYSALLLSDAGASDSPAVINLLQGDFAVRLPLRRWWREWRAVAVVFGIAVALHLVATYSDYLRLKQDNLALRAAVEESYRKAYPRGAVVDAEKQLSRQLSALRGSGQASGFITLMQRVGAVIAGSPGTSIATINYTDKGGEMRMNIVAADFETVEQVREQINKSGLEAIMESSSVQGDQVRARLRIGERS